MAMDTEYEFVIVGAGLGGLAAAIEVKKSGVDRFVVLEKADGVGGTWRANTYPGLEVDVPSFAYSYGYELSSRDWSQLYAPGAEVRAYAERCADKYGVRPHIRFGTEVVEATFDDEQATWRVRLAGGEELTTRYLVNACGYLSDARLPDIPGIDGFAGKVMRPEGWDHDYDLDGKRVAVIGTGASGIQIAPAIADRVAHLDVYQRTAIWLSPKPNFAFPKWARPLIGLLGVPRLARIAIWFGSDLFMRIAFLNYKRYAFVTRRIEKALVNFIRRSVDAPEVAEALIPHYSFFCKRPSLSNTFYPMFNKPHVELVTDPIDHVTPTGIVTKDGTHRDIDVMVCATGYHVFDRSSSPMFEIIGERGANLREWWASTRYRAFRGTTVPGFPNLFLIFGPYVAGGAGYHDIVGSQIAHIRRVLQAAAKRNANYVALKPEVFEREDATLDRALARGVLHAGNCATSNTYYLDRNGDAGAAPRPSSSATAHWLWSRTFPVDHYRYETRAAARKPSLSA